MERKMNQKDKGREKHFIQKSELKFENRLATCQLMGENTLPRQMITFENLQTYLVNSDFFDVCYSNVSFSFKPLPHQIITLRLKLILQLIPAG